MSVRYGKSDCEHDWVFRQDGYEEGCVPIICLKCGAFGCLCNFPGPRPPAEEFFDRGVKSNTNSNGNWENPYVKK
ncbi:MAG: hypothetical protein COU29_02200 [Candidatus Magasanikbacteria bacterium CG10_big_fil_rev_8_21_14_0_10_36_32]|uniref:Uncharacterized protein n=1 Tax=Candidatus Magasanikbacteria bacterium CG10_big_fil_rev_8_21_14_0_10_36_32 TaxID=1974646 RepID=A0A2M6W700_9BACT|nr:MAG: hypothetical protein COU29_02200 [Candidatus Magasanikbacteria bacterium CG10_big_fil_rev_8_21_14_0_10_36_32]